MPELPEVETTKASLSPLIGAPVVDVTIYQDKLREPIPSDLTELVGMTLVAVRRRAKYLYLDFLGDASQKSILIHLGMSGSLGQYRSNQKRKHDHLIIAFAHGVHLHYHDPRRFGMAIWAEDGVRYTEKLGPEPLDTCFDGSYLFKTIHKNPKRPIKSPIKSVIMAQPVVVGVGNIYATESLFLSSIHPATPAHLLTKDALTTLANHIKAVLARAIAQGGSTLKDFSVGAQQTGYFQQTLLAYGRMGAPCTRCTTPLEGIKITGRSSVFCPTCQMLPDAAIQK